MKTILIVEDDKMLLEALKEKLAIEGFDVLEARDGKEGLDILSSKKPDLVLLDVVMPNMDGINMAYRMFSSGMQDIPVIIMTNLTSLAFPDGVREVILKSDTSLSEMVEKVKKVLSVQ